MGRFRFVDWARGIAVVIMIISHTFNAFTSLELRNQGFYRLSQYVGGMASVLFLFLAGMTLAFKMGSSDRKGLSRGSRWKVAMGRAGYVLGLAYLFRLSNWLGYFPENNIETILKVDILNAMGLAMVVLATTALVNGENRALTAAWLGIAIAAVAPVVAAWNWSWAPQVLIDYWKPQYGKFGFFPYGAYLAFGVSAGMALYRIEPVNLDAVARWCGFVGLALVLSGQFFAGLPWEFYAKPDFWVSGPSMVTVKVGLSLLLLALAYAVTEAAPADRWSWVSVLGQTSLLIYFVHVSFLYGRPGEPFRGKLGGAATTLATVILTAAMVWLAEARLRWGRRKKAELAPKPAVSTID